jgi:hypothetical protein
VQVQALIGDSHFVGSRILRYESVAPAGPSDGAVVAIPNRHVLLHHHITDLGVVAAVQSMIQVAHNFYVEGPGSLYDGLLWWHDGALTVLPSAVGKKGVEFAPPDAFVELLNRLPPPPDTGAAR